MSKNNETLWLKNCIDSLFHDNKSNWVYKKMEDLSEVNSEESKEATIRDTKLCFMALQEFTTDVFVCDRMACKTYQFPFSIFLLAKSQFEDTSVAAIASECLQMCVNWDYRARSNILRMIIFDDCPEEKILEKLTIFFVMLEDTKRLEDAYMRDCADMSLSEYYQGLVNEVKVLDEERTRDLLKKIRKGQIDYSFVYEPVLWDVNAKCICENYHHTYTKESDKYRTPIPICIDKAVVRFLKKDIEDYVKAGQLGSYSPFWIFGTRQYAKNLNYIFVKKQLIEAHTVNILKCMLENKSEEYSSR